MNNENDTPGIRGIPFYIRVSILLVGIIAFTYIIYISQVILLPLVFSVLVAILLNPIVSFLIRKGMNSVIAILLILICSILLMGGVVFFIVSETYSFSEQLPQLQSKLAVYSENVVNWLSEKFRLSSGRVKEWLSTRTDTGDKRQMLGSAAITVSKFFTLVLLIPVYIFLLLYYKNLILSFISRLFPKHLHITVVEVLSEIRVVVQHYLTGLLIEMAIVSTLTAIGLTILGIQPAILFGLITGLLNALPYVGVLIANVTFVTIALVTKSPSTAVMVFVLYVVVQFIDNNIVVPKIVGSKVQLNALATLLIVLIGGELCGVAGMILAIPVLGIAKVIFDRIKSLEPLGYLIGEHMPKSGKNIFRL